MTALRKSWAPIPLQQGIGAQAYRMGALRVYRSVRRLRDHASGSTYGAVVSRSMSCTCGVSLKRGLAAALGCLLSEEIKASVLCGPGAHGIGILMQCGQAKAGSV